MATAVRTKTFVQLHHKAPSVLPLLGLRAEALAKAWYQGWGEGAIAVTIKGLLLYPGVTTKPV